MGILDFLGSTGNQSKIRIDRNIRKDVKQLEKQLKTYRSQQNSLEEGKTLEMMGFLYFDHQSYEEAIEQWLEALRVYQETNNRSSMAGVYSNLGSAARKKGDVKNAARHYNKALLLDHEFNPGVGELTSLHNLGSTWLDMGDYSNALDVFNNAMEISRAHNHVHWQTVSLYRLGLTYLAMNNYRDAFRFFNESLRLAADAHDLEMITQNTFNLGHCYEMLGDYGQALPCFQDALDGATHLESKHLVCMILIQAAHLNMMIGQFDAAREMARRASDEAPPNPPLTLQIELALLKARIYANQGMWEKAFQMISDAESASGQFADAYYQAIVLLRRAEFELESGHFEDAHDAVNAIASKYPPGKSALIDLEVSSILGQVYRGLKQDDEALKARETTIRKAEQLGNPRFLWRAYHSIGRFYHHQQLVEQAKEHYQIALKWVDQTSSSLDASLRQSFLHHKERLQIYQDYVILLVSSGDKETAGRILKRLNSEALTRKVQHFF
jgi:tetratricopeptide (TPR) repeat protein